MHAFAAFLLALLAAPGDEDPRRQFDFWVGEWSVQNRHIQDDGTWRDGTTTRARITPVCGGAAILEEWAGPFRGTFMNGFSLRAWNPDAREWQLVLFWTTDGSSSFGQLSGTFRHGRGEFFVPGGGAQRTRYTFSDALADSVRWDSAHTTDAGVTWRTDWIMEFSRTRAAAETTQERLFEVDWTEGSLSPHAEARELDWMLGEWAGVQTLASGEEREARLSAKLLDKDCLVVDLLRTRASSNDPWHEALAVRGFEAGNRRWVGWHVAADDTRLTPSRGGLREGTMEFRSTRASGERIEYLIPIGDDQIQIEVAQVPGSPEGDADGETRILYTCVLERVAR